MNDIQLNLFGSDEWVIQSCIFDSVNESFPNDESSELEYKSAKGGFPRDFWKTYSSFANTDGGIVILGVSEIKHKLTIEGLAEDDIPKYIKQFWDECNNLNTISKSLLFNEDIKVIEIKEKKIIAFRIPMAKRTEKPVFVTRNPFGNTYKRNHEGDYKCTDEEVRRMLADANVHLNHDNRILENYSFEDIDLESFNKYRQLFSSAKPGHAWLTMSNIELLEKLGGYRKDRASKKEGFTLAGILMFGKQTSIIDPECAPDFFPDYREILTNDPNIRWTDRIYPDGTWEANLFQYYLKVWPKLESSLPKPFILKDGIRQDESPAHTALRESFINALVHSDYKAQGNIIIEHRTDSFLFSNPGTLLVSLFQYYQGGISECRNPNIQKMFLMIGSAEKAGSGVNKIMLGWKQSSWQRPYLRVDQQPDRITLHMPMFSIIPADTLEELRLLFGDKIDSLNSDQLTSLSLCQIEGEISNNRLQYSMDRHKTEITKMLQDLCKEGYLISDYKGRWTTYHIKENTSDIKENTSDNKENTSDNKENTSDNKENTSDIKENTSSDDKKRLKREELEAIIINITTNEFMSVEAIAKRINKDLKYLKKKILPEMIKTGKIKRLHPNILHHPGQAYKANID